MSTSVTTIVYPVDDLDATKPIFTALLGAEPHTDESYYVGYTVRGQEVALDPNGQGQGLSGPLPYWHVEDIDASTKSLVDLGAAVALPARDVGGGKLLAVLTDPTGNHIGLIQEPGT